MVIILELYQLKTRNKIFTQSVYRSGNYKENKILKITTSIKYT